MKKHFAYLIFLLTLINSHLSLAQKQGQTKIDSLLQELPKAKDDTNKVNLLVNLSYGYYAINPDEGIKYGLQGILLSEKIQWKKGIALSSKNLGVCYWSKSNHPRALDYYFKALKINEEIGNKLGIAINFGNIGIIYVEQFNFQKALEYFFKALKGFEELGDKAGIARNLGNIGLVYRNQSNDSLALDYYFKALKMYQNLNNKSGISINLGNIGNIYANQSDYSEALKYYFKALKVFEELGDKSGTARNLGNIGGLYIRLAKDTFFSKIKEKTNFISLTKEANLESGIEYSLKAVKICQEIGDLNSLVEFYKNLYAGHKCYGNYTKALEFHELYQITKDSVFNIENSHHIANLEAKRETQLKEKEIEVLNKEKENHQIIRKFLIILSILGFVITLLIIFFYRRKKKDNKLLEEKNIQINNSNIELKQLNENLVVHENELEKYSLHLESLVAERTQDLVVAMTEIEKASKLKTEIIANMNHEIRTPLNFIKMSASLIKMSIDVNNSKPELLDTFDDLNIGVHRLSRTLELFADLSSIKSGNFKTNISTFSLIPILENLYYNYRSRIVELKKPIETIYNCSLVDAYIMADEQSTAKTIEFIIDNAVKFTKAGHVQIELLQNEDSKYQLSIEDTGIGISEDFKDKIYEPFSQEDMSGTREYEGIGLSLSLAYEYAIANKFDMRFESEKGKGTKFVLEFDKYEINDFE